jgi:hypothetical protein
MMAKDQEKEVPEATPENSTMDGQSFYAPHLTGSGTLMGDGTYGPPIPDPVVQRGGPKGYRTSPGGVDRSVDDREPPASPRAPAQKRAARTRRTREEIEASTPVTRDADQAPEQDQK